VAAVKDAGYHARVEATVHRTNTLPPRTSGSGCCCSSREPRGTSWDLGTSTVG
jgi:hypothetical protein